MKRIDQRTYLAAAVLIACVAAFPLLAGGGLLNTRGGGDSPFLIQRLHQLTTAIQDGHFPVRWMPDSNYGYGYPFFNFYASLAFYVAYLFRLIGFGTIRAIQLSQLAGFIVAGWGMYRLALRWWSRPAVALLVSAAYTLAPFHLVNVYVRGDSIAEFWAMAFYPLVIWAVDALFCAETTRERIYQTAMLGLLYGGLVVSHNVSAMIFSPFVGLYALGCMWRNRATRQTFLSQSIYFTAAIFCGLAVSAWFWLPAIGEQGLTQLSEITVGYFDYNFGDGFHFRSTNLWQTSFFYDPDVTDGNAFRMGLVQAILVVCGLGAWGWQVWQQKMVSRQSLLLLGGLALATFMMHPWSRFLWGNLPLISYTQFPWRFLSIQAFWGAAVCGHLLLLFRDKHGDGSESTAVPTVSLLALVVILLVSSLGGFQHDYLIVPESEITGEGITEYEWFTGNIGTTISAEYLSGTMSPRPYTSDWLQTGDRWQAKTITGDASATLLNHRTHEQIWQINVAEDDSTIAFPLMFWPGWIAETAAGEPLDLHTLDGSGFARLILPQGEHEIRLRLTRTPLRLIGELISLLAIPLLLGIIWWQRPLLPTNRWRPEPRRIFAVVVCMAAIVVLGQSLDRQLQQLPDGVTSWDFGQMGYLHYDGTVTYGNGAVLANVDYDVDEVFAGKKVNITLSWGEAPEGDVRDVLLTLTTPADNFFNDIAPIASQSLPLTKGEVVYTLQIPENAPAGLYVPHVALSDRNRPRTPAENKRGFLYLPPIRVMSEPETVDVLDLDVRAVAMTHLPPRVLQYQLQWAASGLIEKPYIMSLRLTDQFGQEMHQAQIDVQTGYGQRPSTLWPTDRWVNDWVTMHLPADGTPFPPPYVVIAKLYDPQDGRIVLTRRLGQLLVDENRPDYLRFVPHQPIFELPENIVKTDVILEAADGRPLISLRGYEIIENEDGLLDLTLYWEALDPIPADYYHFVHLIDPATGQPAAQHDGQPQNNTYPTSQWQIGEIVADPLTISTADLTSGEYQLTTGLYEILGDSYPRLYVVDSEDEADPNGVISLQTYQVEP